MIVMQGDVGSLAQALEDPGEIADQFTRWFHFLQRSSAAWHRVAELCLGQWEKGKGQKYQEKIGL